MFFRRKTIFHVEEAMPDPEELKLRFRRRVLLLTFLGFLVVLAIPVARDMRPDLVARLGTRNFAEKLLETRSLASAHRTPVSLELGDDSHSWKRVFHGAGEGCVSPSAGAEEAWDSEVTWKLQVQKEGGETLSGRSLCLHPTLGILLDATPVNGGRLLVTALKQDGEKRWKESAYLLIGQYGSDLEMVTTRIR